MLENGNATHALMASKVRNDEKVMQNVCHLLPKDRLLQTDIVEEDILDESDFPVVIDPQTKAKLMFSNSLTYLAIFAAAVPASCGPGQTLPMRSSSMVTNS